MRLATPLAIVALAAALLSGCGGSSSSSTGGSTQTGTGAPSKTSGSGSGAPSAPVGASARECATHAVNAEGLRAVGVSCDAARKVMYGWQLLGACAPPSAASRTSCTVRSFRCLSGRTDRGVVVGCSRPGKSIAFVAKRD
jgi:hypothetical protein